ncbi:MAG: hypothetical protein IPQ07_37440 [Myxococcales bacterium]|nr:hypothetical protein [Myxococcales bacterium]
MPTVEEIRNSPDEQPERVAARERPQDRRDAKVFLSIAKMFKKVEFVFAVPLIILIRVAQLFVLVIGPRLTEIIKLLARASSGEAGGGRRDNAHFQ